MSDQPKTPSKGSYFQDETHKGITAYTDRPIRLVLTLFPLELVTV